MVQGWHGQEALTIWQRFQFLAESEIESLEGYTSTNACKQRSMLWHSNLHTKAFGESFGHQA